MRIAFFYHSIVSDWNNGNAHFLRGIATELVSRGHDVKIFEPENGWSLHHLVKQSGRRPLRDFYALFPGIRPHFYPPGFPHLEQALEDTDVVLLHEWNEPWLMRRIVGLRHDGGAFRLLFHDTHHRFFSSPRKIEECELHRVDGVLAFGEVLRSHYLRHGVGPAWTWHEAADSRMFYPRPRLQALRDVVWIGNAGDGERQQEYETFLFEPIRELGLKSTLYGVRYESADLRAMADAGIDYRGWLANYEVPQVFAGHRLTLHILRRPYREKLKGIPTIRLFEALSCGIPLICTPWEDVENLFTPGKDFLIAKDGRSMKKLMREVLHEPGLAEVLSEQGRQTILDRHTCAHRVDELIAILRQLDVPGLRNTKLKPEIKKAAKL